MTLNMHDRFLRNEIELLSSSFQYFNMVVQTTLEVIGVEGDTVRVRVVFGSPYLGGREFTFPKWLLSEPYGYVVEHALNGVVVDCLAVHYRDEEVLVGTCVPNLAFTRSDSAHTQLCRVDVVAVEKNRAGGVGVLTQAGLERVTEAVRGVFGENSFFPAYPHLISHALTSAIWPA